MQIATFEVVGVSPLLMNNPASMLDKSDGGVSTKKKYVTADEAEKSAYRLPAGGLWFPTIGFRSAIMTAATGRKIDKRAASAVIAGSVFIVDQETLLFDPATGHDLKDYEIDIRRAVVQRAAVPRVRARVPHWMATVSFEYDPDFIRPDIIEELLNLAGKIVGVGDFRPAKKGEFGRFTAQEVKA